MQRSLFWKSFLCVFALFILAAMELWGSYLFRPIQIENAENNEIQLVPQKSIPLSAVVPNRSYARATFAGSPYRVGRTITPTTTFSEAETNISINPIDSATLVSVITDYSLRPGTVDTNGVTKFAISSDLGRTWSESFVPLASNVYGATSDGFSWLVDRDPGITIDTAGNVYISGLYLKFPSGSDASLLSHAVAPGGMYVCAGVLPSVTLTSAACRPVYADTAVNPTTTVDRGWIAVDRSTSAFSGNVYAVWTLYTGCAGTSCQAKFIAFSRSTDHGVTWSAAIQLNIATQTIVDWAMVTVGGDGTVYVAYEYFVDVNNSRQHWIVKSTDGGVTFNTPIQMTPTYHEVVFNAPFRKNSAPNIIVSSVAGKEYVYDVFPAQNGNFSDILMVRSNKPKGLGGFTTPVALNDTSVAQRVFPAATVDGNGTLHTIWLDTRNSPSRQSCYDVYGTYSKDLGVTFAPNARVTRTIINGNTDFLGDYFGITAEPSTGIAHPVWSNGGDLNGHLQTTTLTPQ